MTDIVNAQSERAEHALLEGTTEEYAFFDDGGQVVPILEWSFVAIAVMILLCLIHKNNRSRSNMDASRHPNVVEIERERRKEEAKRKKTIIKLFQTEHIQQVRIKKSIDFVYKRLQRPSHNHTAHENIVSIFLMCAENYR